MAVKKCFIVIIFILHLSNLNVPNTEKPPLMNLARPRCAFRFMWQLEAVKCLTQD